jgi:hypothetical protein
MLLGYDRLRLPYLISRRSFGKLLAAAPLFRAFAGERNMFLSLNSVLLKGRVHWPDFARLAAQIGFPGTDIMLRPAWTKFTSLREITVLQRATARRSLDPRPRPPIGTCELSWEPPLDTGVPPCVQIACDLPCGCR